VAAAANASHPARKPDIWGFAAGVMRFAALKRILRLITLGYLVKNRFVLPQGRSMFDNSGFAIRFSTASGAFLVNWRIAIAPPNARNELR
jgi:hypothetical protein